MVQETSEAVLESPNLGVSDQSASPAGLGQDEVNRLVSKRYNAGLEKGKQEGREAILRELQAQQSMSQQSVPGYQTQQPISAAGYNPGSPATPDIGAIIDQRFQEMENKRLQQEQSKAQQEYESTLNQVRGNVQSKINEDKASIPDFDTQIKNAGIDMQNIPSLNVVLGHVDNPAHVLAELAKRPTSVLNLERNASYMTPQDLSNPNHPVFAEIRQISNQIKQNANPKKAPDEPLNTPSSPNLSVDSGKQSVYEQRMAKILGNR